LQASCGPPSLSRKNPERRWCPVQEILEPIGDAVFSREYLAHPDLRGWTAVMGRELDRLLTVKPLQQGVIYPQKAALPEIWIPPWCPISLETDY
jgi:hypothetical protein